MLRWQIHGKPKHLGLFCFYSILYVVFISFQQPADCSKLSPLCVRVISATLQSGNHILPFYPNAIQLQVKLKHTASLLFITYTSVLWYEVGVATSWCVDAPPCRVCASGGVMYTSGSTFLCNIYKDTVWLVQQGDTDSNGLCTQDLWKKKTYSWLSIPRTRISRILRNWKRLSESKIHFGCFLQP